MPEVTTTRIGFGCAGLMREPSARARQRLLEVAFDQGIRHFDVARMYGLGAAEGELGRFARGRRDKMVIATKFGIETASASGRFARFQSPARWLIARCPPVRRYVKRRSGAFHQPHRYDVATARASLHASLRALQTDYVDVLLLHDPLPTDALDLPEICGYLEDARRAGDLKAWGIAGERDPCVEIKRTLPSNAVLQLRHDIRSGTIPASRALEPLITFGILNEVLDTVIAHFAQNPERLEQWSDDVGVDCSSRDELVFLLLRDALQANRNGVVLYSTGQPDRLRKLAPRISANPSDYEGAITEFRRHVSEELVPTTGTTD